MIDTLMTLAALVLSAAYVCRVDRLSWRAHPLLMALHVCGGLAAVGVLAGSGLAGGFRAWDACLLAGAAALLAATYSRLPPAAQACAESTWPPSRGE